MLLFSLARAQRSQDGGLHLGSLSCTQLRSWLACNLVRNEVGKALVCELCKGMKNQHSSPLGTSHNFKSFLAALPLLHCWAHLDSIRVTEETILSVFQYSLRLLKIFICLFPFTFYPFHSSLHFFWWTNSVVSNLWIQMFWKCMKVASQLCLFVCLFKATNWWRW